ncbi:MAG: hypothetical protein ACLGHT_03375 [Acidimicrobiia bacterium]
MEQMTIQTMKPMASPGCAAPAYMHGVSALRSRTGFAAHLLGNGVTVINGGTQWPWSPPRGTPG